MRKPQPEVKSKINILRRQVPAAFRKFLPNMELTQTAARCLAFIMTAQYSALLSVLYIGLPVRHPLILIFMPILIGSAVAVGWQERGIGVVVELQQRPLGMEENPKTRIDVN